MQRFRVILLKKRTKYSRDLSSVFDDYRFQVIDNAKVCLSSQSAKNSSVKSIFIWGFVEFCYFSAAVQEYLD
jgi:hypothetical protein